MSKSRILAITTFAGLLTAACSSLGGNNSATEQSLATENAALHTQIADVRATATVHADRLQRTAEYVETAVRRVDARATALISTLVAQGTPVEAIVLPAAQPGSMVTPLPAPSGGVTPVATIASQSTVIAVITPNLTATPVPPPMLSNIVMSPGVGDNDCALSTQTQFTTDAERIYVAASATNLQPAHVVTSVWRREGEEVARFDWSPAGFVENGCIWFFIDETDVTFTAGNWSVELSIDGGVVGAPVPFALVEAGTT